MPKPYRFAFQTILDLHDFGKPRWIHRRRANQALRETLAGDAESRARVEKLIPGITELMLQSTKLDTPEGWRWHYAIEEGTMRLVPAEEHGLNSACWESLHPEGQGGYAAWAVPEGAPQVEE